MEGKDEEILALEGNVAAAVAALEAARARRAPEAQGARAPGYTPPPPVLCVAQLGPRGLRAARRGSLEGGAHVEP